MFGPEPTTTALLVHSGVIRGMRALVSVSPLRPGAAHVHLRLRRPLAIWAKLSPNLGPTEAEIAQIGQLAKLSLEFGQTLAYYDRFRSTSGLLWLTSGQIWLNAADACHTSAIVGPI